MQRRVPNCRRGFTLVELLIVLAIIGLLASLSFPALFRLNAQTRAAKCGSNLSMASGALHVYAQTYGGFPLLHSAARGRWQKALDPKFAALRGIDGPWSCPSYPGPVVEATGSNSRRRAPNSDMLEINNTTSSIGRASYGYNIGSADTNSYRYGLAGSLRGAGTAITTDELAGPVPEAAVLVPSNLIAIGDSIAVWPYVSTNEANLTFQGFDILTPKLHRDLRDNVRSRTNMPPVANVARHDARANVSFVDGHVERIPIKNLFFSRDPADLRRWHIDNQPHLELFQ